ncbi:GNAT family N-acetyltransferase [Devosia sp. A8/3-2]|nr:GNAT family N-acetyltransferase [Devosia sp. A8/3-2]
MQNMGMRLEAHYREHALFRGEWDEELHFAMLDREWNRPSKVRNCRNGIASPDLHRARQMGYVRLTSRIGRHGRYGFFETT